MIKSFPSSDCIAVSSLKENPLGLPKIVHQQLRGRLSLAGNGAVERIIGSIKNKSFSGPHQLNMDKEELLTRDEILKA